MSIKWIRRVAGMAASAAVLMLGGCASYVTTKVTAFQDWHASDADKTSRGRLTPAAPPPRSRPGVAPSSNGKTAVSDTAY